MTQCYGLGDRCDRVAVVVEGYTLIAVNVITDCSF